MCTKENDNGLQTNNATSSMEQLKLTSPSKSVRFDMDSTKEDTTYHSQLYNRFGYSPNEEDRRMVDIVCDIFRHHTSHDGMDVTTMDEAGEALESAMVKEEGLCVHFREFLEPMVMYGLRGDVSKLEELQMEYLEKRNTERSPVDCDCWWDEDDEEVREINMKETLEWVRELKEKAKQSSDADKVYGSNSISSS